MEHVSKYPWITNLDTNLLQAYNFCTPEEILPVSKLKFLLLQRQTEHCSLLVLRLWRWWTHCDHWLGYHNSGNW